MSEISDTTDLGHLRLDPIFAEKLLSILKTYEQDRINRGHGKSKFTEHEVSVIESEISHLMSQPLYESIDRPYSISDEDKIAMIEKYNKSMSGKTTDKSTSSKTTDTTAINRARPKERSKSGISTSNKRTMPLTSERSPDRVPSRIPIFQRSFSAGQIGENIHRNENDSDKLSTERRMPSNAKGDVIKQISPSSTNYNVDDSIFHDDQLMVPADLQVEQTKKIPKKFKDNTRDKNVKKSTKQTPPLSRDNFLGDKFNNQTNDILMHLEQSQRTFKNSKDNTNDKNVKKSTQNKSPLPLSTDEFLEDEFNNQTNDMSVEKYVLSNVKYNSPSNHSMLPAETEYKLENSELKYKDTSDCVTGNTNVKCPTKNKTYLTKTLRLEKDVNSQRDDIQKQKNPSPSQCLSCTEDDQETSHFELSAEIQGVELKCNDHDSSCHKVVKKTTRNKAHSFKKIYLQESFDNVIYKQSSPSGSVTEESQQRYISKLSVQQFEKGRKKRGGHSGSVNSSFKLSTNKRSPRLCVGNTCKKQLYTIQNQSSPPAKQQVNSSPDEVLKLPVETELVNLGEIRQICEDNTGCIDMEVKESSKPTIKTRKVNVGKNRQMCKDNASCIDMEVKELDTIRRRKENLVKNRQKCKDNSGCIEMGLKEPDTLRRHSVTGVYLNDPFNFIDEDVSKPTKNSSDSSIHVAAMQRIKKRSVPNFSEYKPYHESSQIKSEKNSFTNKNTLRTKPSANVLAKYNNVIQTSNPHIAASSSLSNSRDNEEADTIVSADEFETDKVLHSKNIQPDYLNRGVGLTYRYWDHEQYRFEKHHVESRLSNTCKTNNRHVVCNPSSMEGVCNQGMCNADVYKTDVYKTDVYKTDVYKTDVYNTDVYKSGSRNSINTAVSDVSKDVANLPDDTPTELQQPEYWYKTWLPLRERIRTRMKERQKQISPPRYKSYNNNLTEYQAPNLVPRPNLSPRSKEVDFSEPLDPPTVYETPLNSVSRCILTRKVDPGLIRKIVAMATGGEFGDDNECVYVDALRESPSVSNMSVWEEIRSTMSTVGIAFAVFIIILCFKLIFLVFQ